MYENKCVTTKFQLKFRITDELIDVHVACKPTDRLPPIAFSTPICGPFLVITFDIGGLEKNILNSFWTPFDFSLEPP